MDCVTLHVPHIPVTVIASIEQDALAECEAWSALRIATCQSYVNIIIAKCSVMMHMRLCAITYDLELQRT